MKNTFRVDHSLIYFFGLALLIVSLPLSKFGMSVAQFILAGNWLWEADFRNKIRKFVHDKPALVIVSILLLHIIGLIYTTDLNYALNDLRVKLPLLVFPVIISTSAPLSAKQFRVLILLFTGAVVSGTLISTGILLTRHILDIREISPLISHIRFSLNICLAVVICAYFLWQDTFRHKGVRIALAVAAAWLMVFLILLESVTGIMILGIVAVFLVIHFVFHSKSLYTRLITGLVFTVSVAFALMYLHDEIKSYRKPWKNDLQHLEWTTSRGNAYTHDTVSLPVENGSFIGLYICESELRDSWNLRSGISYDSVGGSGFQVKSTLLRYLNSMGLRKDADGVKTLSDKDIRDIENGIANVEYHTGFNFRSRLYKILFEIEVWRRGSSPGGNSILQRIEFWKTSLRIMRENLLTGVGTGDVNQAFAESYAKGHTMLPPEFRLRSHNQYLAIGVAFGLAGLAWFIFALVYPPVKRRRFSCLFFRVFFLIAILSMLTEDTLETQGGATFFAFFYTFILYNGEETG